MTFTTISVIGMDIYVVEERIVNQGGIRMQHSSVNRPAISKCSRCGRTKYTLHLLFKQNVSYFFGRKERQFSGDLCFSCASKTFASVELTTLFWTWWGIIGFWLGPLYIVHNLVEYIIATFRFVRSEKYVRKGLLRLCHTWQSHHSKFSLEYGSIKLVVG
jgi:hypothetical protein